MSEVIFTHEELTNPLTEATIRKMEQLGLPPFKTALCSITISIKHTSGENDPYWYITAHAETTDAWLLSGEGSVWQLKALKSNREYTTSPLPTMAAGKNDPEILKLLYGEICSNWRQLVDVRFKLLGFVPVVSATILFNLFSVSKDGGLSSNARLFIAVFGLIITYALRIYDKRNTQLYNDLASRAKKIEQELGVDSGQFLGRLSSNEHYLIRRNLMGLNRIQHDVSLRIIYGACLLSWVGAIIFVLLNWGKFPG